MDIQPTPPLLLTKTSCPALLVGLGRPDVLCATQQQLLDHILLGQTSLLERVSELEVGGVSTRPEAQPPLAGPPRAGPPPLGQPLGPPGPPPERPPAPPAAAGGPGLSAAPQPGPAPKGG